MNADCGMDEDKQAERETAAKDQKTASDRAAGANPGTMPPSEVAARNQALLDANAALSEAFPPIDLGDDPGAGVPQNCEQGLNGSGANGVGARACCTDPMTCLGGSALSTANSVGQVVTAVGPGIAMGLQGMGSDMSGLCKAIQALAGTGATLNVAAQTKCTSSISACHKACDRDIKKKCQKYQEAVTQCYQAQSMNTAMNQAAYNTLQTKAEKLYREVTEYKGVQNACSALTAQVKNLAENMGQMANSALTAEMCKQQASMINDKESCREAGGRWNGYDCDTSNTQQAQCEARGGQWLNNECENSQENLCLHEGGTWINGQCDNSSKERCLADGGSWIERQCQFGKARCLAKGGTWKLRQCNLPKETPKNTADSTDPKDPTEEEEQNIAINDASDEPVSSTGSSSGGLSLVKEGPPNPDGEGGSGNTTLGGGGNTQAAGASDSSDLGADLPESEGSEGFYYGYRRSGSAGGGSKAGKGSRGGFGGGRGLGRGRGYAGGGGRAGGSDNKKKGFGNMGGGGFNSYGGGKDSNGYAGGLGLSKKQLEDLKKKQGTKRKTASESGGAHQNIFERITKRFQSLCQNRLDCR